MAAGWQIQGRDALTGGAAGDALGSLGVYVQGITTGGTSSLNGATSPQQTSSAATDSGGALLPLGQTQGLQSPNTLLLIGILALVAVAVLRR
jgi:hypothetical protein